MAINPTRATGFKKVSQAFNGPPETSHLHLDPVVTSRADNREQTKESVNLVFELPNRMNGFHSDSPPPYMAARPIKWGAHGQCHLQ